MGAVPDGDTMVGRLDEGELVEGEELGMAEAGVTVIETAVSIRGDCFDRVCVEALGSYTKP